MNGHVYLFAVWRIPSLELVGLIRQVIHVVDDPLARVLYVDHAPHHYSRDPTRIHIARSVW